MNQTFSVTIPKLDGEETLVVSAGQSIVFLGANGSGKTRLGVHIDRSIPVGQSHRIGAHRALNLNTNVQAKNLDTALAELFYGTPDPRRASQKETHRWAQKPYTMLLNDYDKLLVALFAEENEISTKFRQDHRNDPSVTSPESKLDRLASIWNRLLPHRSLIVGANSIKVKPANETGILYDAGGLSDGERVIFYIIGQCLLCPENGVLLIDEPELHINRAILQLVYDEIEAERKDCAFIYITHDLDFAIGRQTQAIFTVRSCQFKVPGEPQTCQWDVSLVPRGIGLEEEFVATIVGSRHPILFVEGGKGSLDSLIYRWLYPEFTVIPAGGCDAVIHSVVTLNSRSDLHRLRASGLIDYDHRSIGQLESLASESINVLPVSEAENLLVLPEVVDELAMQLHFSSAEADEMIKLVKGQIFERVSEQKEAIALRKTKRWLDQVLQRTDVNERDVDSFVSGVTAVLEGIDPRRMYDQYLSSIDAAVNSKDLESLLLEVDDKGLVSLVSNALGFRKKAELQDFLGRTLRSRDGKKLTDILRRKINASFEVS